MLATHMHAPQNTYTNTHAHVTYTYLYTNMLFKLSTTRALNQRTHGCTVKHTPETNMYFYESAPHGSAEFKLYTQCVVLTSVVLGFPGFKLKAKQPGLTAPETEKCSLERGELLGFKVFSLGDRIDLNLIIIPQQVLSWSTIPSGLSAKT